MRTALEDPTSITVFSDEWKHLEEPYLSEFLERRRDYEQRFRDIIQQGIRTGEFQSLDPFDHPLHAFDRHTLAPLPPTPRLFLRCGKTGKRSSKLIDGRVEVSWSGSQLVQLKFEPYEQLFVLQKRIIFAVSAGALA
ncbi:MAG: hypothetical protein IPH04_19665 [Saprospirales bacterium]|nr:hypothetical protein [Saprospirales bacterium]